MATPTSKIQVIVVTPEKAVLDEHADFVVLPLHDGEIGIQHDHAAFVGQLGPGEFRYTIGGTIVRYYIDGGFAQVRTNTVTVLTAKAIKSTDLTPAKAEEAILAAETLPLTNSIERTNREKALARATGMARVAAKNG